MQLHQALGGSGAEGETLEQGDSQLWVLEGLDILRLFIVEDMDSAEGLEAEGGANVV